MNQTFDITTLDPNETGKVVTTGRLGVKVKKLQPAAIMPVYSSAGAACFDLHALGDMEQPATIMPGGVCCFDTGLAFEVPAGHVMLIFSRSGHGFKSGVRLSNGTGVIDSDYRGEVKVSLTNDGRAKFRVGHGDRIAQAMVLPIPYVTFKPVEDLGRTARGTAGFGSTGA